MYIDLKAGKRAFLGRNLGRNDIQRFARRQPVALELSIQRAFGEDDGL